MKDRTTLFRARYMVPITAPPLEDGALLVEQGRIAAVGSYASLRRNDAVLVDCGDAVLLPPLVNAHTHLELTDYPRWAATIDDLPTGAGFVDWIRRVMRVKRSRSAEEYQASVAAGVQLALAAGTGAVGDILSWLPAAAAHCPSPLRGRLFYETLGRDPGRTRPQLLALSELLAAGPVGHLVPGLSPHAPYTLSAQHLEETLTLALRQQTPLSMHVAEAADEVDFIAAAAGPLAAVLYPLVGWGDDVPPPQHCSPVAWLSRRGGLRAGMLLVHGVQVDAADVLQIAAAGCGMVLCPRSNEQLGVGTAPAALYRRHHVPLALGTDSLASNDSLSLWDELAAARRLYPELTPRVLLHMATAGGAALLGLSGEMGSLAPGSGAHFQLLRPAALPPLSELDEFLCTHGRSAEVAQLWLGGEEVLAKADALRL